jgi:hypothetical protein
MDLYKKKGVIKSLKNIDVGKTILLNFGLLGYPLFVIVYFMLCLNALDKTNFIDPFLRLPFLILIAYSAIKLMMGYNPQPKIVVKK